MTLPEEGAASRFEELFRRHYLEVLRFALRRTDEATAEDVTSEVFTICWRRLESVPEHALPWLYVTARHELHNRCRAAQRAEDKRRRASVGAPGIARDPAEALAERDAVVRAFLSLDDRDREALRLVTWDGLSLADAARVAGTSRPAFAMRVLRARRRLATALEAAGSAPTIELMEPTL